MLPSELSQDSVMKLSSFGPYHDLIEHTKHRCALIGFTENIVIGINFMELDCHLSKDGEVIIAHDADLERMCGSQHQGKMLKNLNFAELPKM